MKKNRPASKLGVPPTPRQAEIYRLILEHFAKYGLPPTIREIGTQAGIESSNGVVHNLLTLHKKGLIEYSHDRTSRGITIPVVTDATKKAAAGMLAAIARRPLATTGPTQTGVRAKKRTQQSKL